MNVGTNQVPDRRIWLRLDHCEQVPDRSTWVTNSKGAAMYAVCVTFKLKGGQAAVFIPLMRENAQTSLANEAGCVQFDVLTDPAQPDSVFLYEVYTDRAAFDAHLASTHFKSFDAATAGMIAQKDVQTWSEVSQ